MSVREGREPDRNRNRGREAGPFPDGAGSARPLLTPRPRPGGAAPQFAARTLAAAQPGHERAPPTHPVTRLRRAPRTPRRPCLLHQRADPGVFPLRDPPLTQGLSLSTLFPQLFLDLLIPQAQEGVDSWPI